MDNAVNRRNESLLFQSHLLFLTACSILCHGKNIVTQWFKINSDAEAKSDRHEEIQEKNRSSEIVDEDLETNFVELSDLDEELSDEEKEEDNYESIFLVELPEETELSFETEGKFFSVKSGIYSNEKNKLELEEERRRKVFCNSFPPSDGSFDLGSSELDSTLSSLKHENRNDNLQVSSKVMIWDLFNEYKRQIDNQIVIINDIVALSCTYEKLENVNESSKGHDDFKSKTAYSKEAAVFPQCANDVENIEIKPKKKRKSARKRSERRTQRSLRDIINWQTSLRRNPTVLYDVLPGTTNGRTAFHEMAHSGSNENSEDSRGVVNGFVSEAQPQIAVQSKSGIERDHLHASGVQETLEIPLEYQNGIVDNKSAQITDNKSAQIIDNKSAQIIDNKSSQATEEGDREKGASYSSPLQSASASNGFSLTTTETLSSFFDSVSLLSVGEDEAFSFEWIRLKTFSDWPLTSIFSTTLARNGWVSLGEGDRARCYSCHVVHEGWRIGDDPDQYHSSNCRFKSGQSNNIPISRETSNQTPNLGQISRDHQQFPSPGNPLYPGNLSGVASSVGHPGPVQGLTEQGLNRPQQDSFHPQESNIQPQETILRPQENFSLPLGNLTRPQENYLQPQGNFSRPQETRETITGPLTGSQNVTPSQQLSSGQPTSEAVAAHTHRNTDASRHTDNPRNTSTPTPQVPTDNLHSTAAAEAPSPHSKEAQLEALKRDPMGINFDRPKYPSYAILAVRISSYTDWPAAMTQTPRDMALAGFFYAGYGDYTRCFFCGGGLRNWEAGDDPWVEHARWFKKCAFVRQNRGQEFIDLVQKRAAELDEQGNQEEIGNQQTNTAISDPNSAQAKEEKVMRSPAVTTIKEMGYSEEKIKAAIHTIKSRLPRGKHKVSAQEILEVIFELNQSESGTPVGQSERVPENPTNNDSVAENTSHHMSQSDPAPQGNQNAASPMDASNADQTSLDDQENRNSLPNPIFDELTSLKQENSSLKDQIICKICMEKNVSIAFLPCGHLACCEDCAPAMRKCPICREFVRGTVKTFLV